MDWTVAWDALVQTITTIGAFIRWLVSVAGDLATVVAAWFAYSAVRMLQVEQKRDRALTGHLAGRLISLERGLESMAAALNDAVDADPAVKLGRAGQAVSLIVEQLESYRAVSAELLRLAAVTAMDVMAHIEAGNELLWYCLQTGRTITPAGTGAYNNAGRAARLKRGLEQAALCFGRAHDAMPVSERKWYSGKREYSDVLDDALRPVNDFLQLEEGR